MERVLGLVSVGEMSGFRVVCGMKCATTKGIENQINALKSGKLAPKDVGFELVGIGGSAVRLRLLDPRLEKFRLQLIEYAKLNCPK